MSRRLVSRRRARRDIDGAAARNERERALPGDDFMEELEHVLFRVREAPEHSPSSPKTFDER